METPSFNNKGKGKLYPDNMDMHDMYKMGKTQENLQINEDNYNNKNKKCSGFSF